MDKLDYDARDVIYKKTVSLPRLQKKMLHKNEEKNIRDAINKLTVICSYKVTNRETLINKYKKLTQFYISYLLLINSPPPPRKTLTSFIGKNKVDSLTDALDEMCGFWTKDIIIHTLNSIVMSINFKDGKDKRKKDIFSVVASFLSSIIYNHLNSEIYFEIVHETISEYNVTKTDVDKLTEFLTTEYKTESQIINSLIIMNKYWKNNDIYNYFGLIISEAKFNNSHTCNDYFVKFITIINEMGLLKKNIFEELVFNVVSKNAGVICRKLYDSLNEWLEDLGFTGITPYRQAAISP